MLQKTKEDGSNRIIVFIGGYTPSPADLALAEKHGTNCFRNAMVDSTVENHLYAVAVPEAEVPKDEKGNRLFEVAQIPEGYTHYEAKPAKAPKAPAASSVNPATPPWDGKGTKPAGLAADGE